MSGGFNTNVERGGRVLHLQTQECWGRPAVVESLVYDGGRIVASLVNSYAEAGDGTAAGSDRVRRMMRLQHQRLLLEIRQGLHDGSLDVQPPPGPAAAAPSRPAGADDRRLALQRVLSRLERNVAAEQVRGHERPTPEPEPTPPLAEPPVRRREIESTGAVEPSRVIVRVSARRAPWAVAALVLLLGAVGLLFLRPEPPPADPVPPYERPASLLDLPRTEPRPEPGPAEVEPNETAVEAVTASPEPSPTPPDSSSTEPTRARTADTTRALSSGSTADLEPLPRVAPEPEPVVRHAVEPMPTAPVVAPPTVENEPPPPPTRLVPARPIRRELPPYPKKDRRRGVEGAVRLRLAIDTRGHVAAVEILESVPGAKLHEVVEEAAAAWRFAPATRDGQAVPEERAVTVQFELGPGRSEIVRVVEDRPL